MTLKQETLRHLEQLSHRPIRDLGQNFLIDGSVIQESLCWAQLRANENVVEIGPGLGTLTAHLLQSGANVFAVELDATLASSLKNRFLPTFQNRFHLREADAVKFPRAGLPAGEERDYKIVANLPYAISTPWMDGILSGPLPSTMTLLLQHETAQRFCAKTGTKSFGAISLRLQSSFRLVHHRRVDPGSFFPMPCVNSALIHLERLPAPFLFSPPTYAFVRYLFNFRRKQLAHVIRQYAQQQPQIPLQEWFSRASWFLENPAIRAEQLTIDQWQSLETDLHQNYFYI